MAGRSIPADGPRVSVRVPAKLNLFLAVRGRRADGYHELVTVLQTVSVYDELRAGVVGPPSKGHHPAGRRKMRLELWQDPRLELPEGEENLAVRAARALGEAAGVLAVAERDAGPSSEIADAALPRTVLDLHKDIPVAAGMAGGSADAAAALVALNELWGCELERADLRSVAAELGSDVPFCVVGGTALATGRGTHLAQVLCRGAFHWVICESDKPLETGAVYSSWDRRCRASEIEPDAVLAALRAQDPVALGAALHNELEPAAFALRPALAEAKQDLLDAGALGVVLAGSGPTLAGLVADAADARRLADELADRFARVRPAQSPVGGPELHL